MSAEVTVMSAEVQSIHMVVRPYLRTVDPVGPRDLTLQNSHVVCDAFTRQHFRRVSSGVRKAFPTFSHKLGPFLSSVLKALPIRYSSGFVCCIQRETGSWHRPPRGFKVDIKPASPHQLTRTSSLVFASSFYQSPIRTPKERI